MAVLIFLIYSLAGALLWANIAKKKFSLGLYKRFILLNLALLIFIVPAAIVAILIIAALGMLASSITNYALLYLISFISIILLLIPITITFLAYNNFIKQNRIFDAIKEGFALAFKKIKTLALPLALIAVTSIIISVLFGLVPGLRTNPAYMVIYALVFLFYIALARFYIITAAE